MHQNQTWLFLRLFPPPPYEFSADGESDIDARDPCKGVRKVVGACLVNVGRVFVFGGTLLGVVFFPKKRCCPFCEVPHFGDGPFPLFV